MSNKINVKQKIKIFNINKLNKLKKKKIYSKSPTTTTTQTSQNYGNIKQHRSGGNIRRLR